MASSRDAAELDPSIARKRTIAAYKKQFMPIRERPMADVEEDGGMELKLGEFTDVPTLSVSEARFFLEALHTSREKKKGKLVDTEITHKMRLYLDTFARFMDIEHINTASAAMEAYPQLTAFERSQLMTLCPWDYEEAVALIPSLTDHHIKREDLERIIEDIQAARNAS